MISGSPSNSKYISEYLNNNIIGHKSAEKLLYYLQYVNPIYILNYIGLVVLNNKKLGLILLISNIISSLIIKYFNGKIVFNSTKSNNNANNVLRNYTRFKLFKCI